MMKNVLLFAILMAGAFSCSAFGADGLELATIARDGHIQAVSSIRQLECQMEIKLAPWTMINPASGKVESRPMEVQSFSWWEDQGVARGIHRFIGFDIVEEFLWKEGVLKSLKTVRKPGEEPSYGGQYEGSNGIKGVTTAWRSALLYRPDELRALLTDQKVLSATEVTVEGRRLYKVTVNTSDVYREDIFFDPRRNYLIVKKVGYPDLNDLTTCHVDEVTGFTEPKPGILFPMAVNGITVKKGKSKLQMTTTFSSVRINEVIDPSKLQLTFPPGIHVADLRTGKAYTTGPDEQPAGPQESIGKPYDREEKKQYPTTMQPRSSWPTVLIGVGACVTVAAITFAVIRRRRAAA
jgi:hypothetical protein